MNWNWLFKLLIPIFGDILINYILPLVNREVKDSLSKILPVAERWVAAVETTGLSGMEKKVEATKQIIAQLKENKILEVEKGLIDTAIQLAWVKLGLNKK